MSQDRRETRRARKIQKALSVPYTKALRIYRSCEPNAIDWDSITDPELIALFSDNN